MVRAAAAHPMLLTTTLTCPILGRVAFSPRWDIRGHSAATTSDGVVVLWGRPYDFKQTLRTHHVHDFAPWLARLLGRISSKAILLGLEPTMIDGADDEEFVSVSCGAGALTAAVAGE